MSSWLSAGAEEPKDGDAGSDEGNSFDENLLPTNTLFYGVSGQQVRVYPVVQAPVTGWPCMAPTSTAALLQVGMSQAVRWTCLLMSVASPRCSHGVFMQVLCIPPKAAAAR